MSLSLTHTHTHVLSVMGHPERQNIICKKLNIKTRDYTMILHGRRRNAGTFDLKRQPMIFSATYIMQIRVWNTMTQTLSALWLSKIYFMQPAVLKKKNKITFQRGKHFEHR